MYLDINFNSDKKCRFNLLITCLIFLIEFMESLYNYHTCHVIFGIGKCLHCLPNASLIFYSLIIFRKSILLTLFIKKIWHIFLQYNTLMYNFRRDFLIKVEIKRTFWKLLTYIVEDYKYSFWFLFTNGFIWYKILLTYRWLTHDVISNCKW